MLRELLEQRKMQKQLQSPKQKSRANKVVSSSIKKQEFRKSNSYLSTPLQSYCSIQISVCQCFSFDKPLIFCSFLRFCVKYLINEIKSCSAHEYPSAFGSTIPLSVVGCIHQLVCTLRPCVRSAFGWVAPAGLEPATTCINMQVALWATLHRVSLRSERPHFSSRKRATRVRLAA